MTEPMYCVECSQPVSSEGYQTGGSSLFTTQIRKLFYCNNPKCPRYGLASRWYIEAPAAEAPAANPKSKEEQ